MEVSGKSIMGLLTIEGYCGSTLEVIATGEDAVDALKALEELFENNFFED
jgi:phosphotransferase system HPr-like phosphotransfer protein